MIDNWGREISDFGLYIYIYIYITTYMKSIIGAGRLIILLIIIAFRFDLAATFALQSTNLNCISLTG